MKNNVNEMKTLLTVIFSIVFLLSTVPSVALAADGSNVELDIILIKTEPVPLQTGEYADVWVKLTNTGSAISEDTKIEFVSSFPFMEVPGEKIEYDFGKVRPGEEYYARFKVKVDENAVQGENKMKFKLSTGSDVSYTKEIPLQVRTDDAALSIESVNMDPYPLPPSKTGKLNITLENLADSYLKNVELTLNLEGLTSEQTQIPFITLGSSTTKRVQKIEPGKSVTLSFDIKAFADADNKVYKVPISLSFENEAGTGFTQNEYTGIVIGGEPELETNIIESDILQPGTSGEVSISVINRGLSIAKFAKLEILPSEDFKVLSSPSVYIGDMDSDEYESTDFEMYVEPGIEEVEIPIRLTYKDSEGNALVEEQIVVMETYSSDEISRMNLQESNNTWLILLIVVVAGVGIYWYRKRKKKQKKEKLAME